MFFCEYLYHLFFFFAASPLERESAGAPTFYERRGGCYAGEAEAGQVGDELSRPADLEPRAGGAEAIAGLPNLGSKSQAMLAAAGIHSVTQLRALGSVAAYARVKAKVPSASLNLLWALEGALSGLPWQAVAREHRTSLLLSLEQLQGAG